jgi:acyl-coenzyme A synthetase/AMP-(fatty) acid ligase
MYRTGDFAYWSRDRNLIFKGRRDHMVKSRGYRIELGEIEAAIYGHPAVVEACVVAIPDEDAGNLIRACVVADGDLDSDALEQHLSKQLPRYMLPHEIRFSKLLPKTSTGKIDRQALLEESS